MNKLVEFQNLVSMFNSKIVAVTETWLNDSILDGEILPSSFCIHRKDRCNTLPDSRGGGILLAINSSIPSRRRGDLEPQIEILVCEVAPCSSQKIAVVLCYRAPRNDLHGFISHLEKTLFDVNREYQRICVLGDFNLPSINWKNVDESRSAADRDFVILTQMYHLTQLNVAVSNVHNHILDLIFTNCNIVCDITSHCSFPSDHMVLHFYLCYRHEPSRGPQRTVFNYKRANFDLLFSELRSKSLLDVVARASNTSIDSLWSNWFNAVASAVESTVPRVVIKNSNQPPWFDGEVCHAINCKKQLGVEPKDATV
mgnify:CR=1 FL=1